MNFVTALALGVAALVLAPLIAHLLRRGRTPERVFPPARLIAKLESHSKEKARLEDRALLSLRMLMVIVLSVLGATPLVRCSRLSVDRPHGASVALAIVLDDSHSMRAQPEQERSRWDAAIDGARQLLRSLRDGDAVVIVLSGKPARLALSASTDLLAARAALEELKVSDRGSDLEGALGLARSSLEGLEQPDHKLVVLSDLAGSRLDGGDASAPLEALRDPADDCGLIAARRQQDRLAVTLACSSTAAGPRKLRAVSNAAPEALFSDPAQLNRLTLTPRPGVQTLSVALLPGGPDFDLELVPPDENVHNDRVPVSNASAQLNVAVIADPSRASVVTGGPTVIEQALGAVRPDTLIRPLAMLPDDARELEDYAALVLNDPAGLSPESRAALSAWIEAGGVALGLLGPASSGLQLSASLEPFAERSARWEAGKLALDVDPRSLSWLGPEASTLLAVTRSGRTRLDGAALSGSVVAGAWSDGATFLLKRSHGAGLVLTSGLPASVEQSDFALRPAFLALLDHLVGEAEQRRGPGVTLVGERWAFPAGGALAIAGPAGPLRIDTENCADSPPGALDCGGGQASGTPELLGRYSITRAGATQTRVARIDEREIVDAPGHAEPVQQSTAVGADPGAIDASPELALALLGLFAAELALRAAGEASRKRQAARALG
jgi:hypothetical protein